MFLTTPDKRLIQAHVQETTGKRILLRDLHNMSAHLRSSKGIAALNDSADGAVLNDASEHKCKKRF